MIAKQKLALGTVQFGLSYGVTNTTGMTPRHEAAEILQRARSTGIDTLDTAVGYGDSESVLGQLGIDGFKVITKIPAVPENEPNILSWVYEQVRASMGRLRRPLLGGVLLHRPGQLFEPFGPKLYSALEKLKSDGFIEKIGISVYEPSELDQLIPNFKFDLIQAPLSVLDRRLIDSGWAKRLNDLGIEIHARSCFLQGLLLMAAANRPAKFKRFESIWQTWDHWLSKTKLAPVEACIHYATSQPEISRVVVGVNSATQLDEIVQGLKTIQFELPVWPSPPEALLLDPSKWASL